MWIHLLTTELIRGAGGGYNTYWDNGFWLDEYAKMLEWLKKKKDTPAPRHIIDPKLIEKL